MFKKPNKISFIIDDNNDLYIEISENKKDEESPVRLAKLISLLETGSLHDQIVSAINHYGSKQKRNDVSQYLTEAINQSLAAYNEKLYKKYVENKVSNKRDPIITPDLVLTTFKSSINT